MSIKSTDQPKLAKNRTGISKNRSEAVTERISARIGTTDEQRIARLISSFTLGFLIANLRSEDAEFGAQSP